jgi:hypothetical protein
LKVVISLFGNPSGPNLFSGLFRHDSSPSSVMGARGPGKWLLCLSSGAAPRQGIISRPTEEICSNLNSPGPDCGLSCNLTVRQPWLETCLP